MNRREFIKHTTAAVAGTSLLLSACNKKTESSPTASAKGEMSKRINPNTGDEVSLLGYGMMRLPGKEVAEGAPYELDQAVINELVDYALEHGVNYFDTAPVYCRGLSEQATGTALARHPRNKYFVATKLSNFSPDTWSREESMAMFERSLKYLQTDYVDYLLLHSVGGTAAGKNSIQTFEGRYIDNGILDWLVEQKAKGRIRNLGFSYHGDVNIFDMLLRWHDEGKYHWDFVQIQLNFLDWNHAKVQSAGNTNASYLYAELEKRGIPSIVMEPLLGGRLAKQPAHILREMKQKDIHATPAEWAFRYAGTPKGILTVLSGMTYMEHLKENCATYSPLRPITPEEDRMLMQLADAICNLKAIPCTACNYCMPCPYGIDIPAVFGYYNACLTEGLLPEGDKHDTAYRKAKKKWLVGYDKKVERMRQADHCIGCKHCLSHCPQRINIPAQMQMIDNIAEQLKQS
ncbi:MAG: aldo/keto reductase [Paludibacteraceae bacterium]|nr:aldo/keto reductase [Paludibacteraceae bacterium]